MAAGFEVIFGSDSEKEGKAQIDESYVNFHLRKSGIITPSEWTLRTEVGGKTKEVVIDISMYVEPIIVLNPLGNYTTASAVSYETRAGKKCIILNIWNNYTPNANVEYYIFDNYTPPIDNYGLEVKDATDKVVYHSSWYRMRVVGQYIMPLPSKIGDTFDVTIPATIRSLKLGLMMPTSRVSMLKGVSSDDFASLLRDCVYFKNSSTLGVYQVTVNESYGWWYPTTGFWNKSPILILYIDLTNYPTNYTAPE